MSDLPTYQLILKNTFIMGKIAQLTDLSEMNNLSQVDRSTYYLMTDKTTVHSIWSACLNLNQKIPLSIYVPLHFRPRVHVFPETPPRPLETFDVYEINYAELPDDRAIVQFRQIPYITDPELHLLDKTQAERSLKTRNILRKSRYIYYAQASREAIMRKECSVWLNFLRKLETNRSAAHLPYDSHQGFSLYSLMEILLNHDNIDLEYERPDGQSEKMEKTGYPLIMDLLVSGKLSFDQFKSINLPTPRSVPTSPRAFAPHETIDIGALKLYETIADQTTVQNNPVHTILFFKRIREMVPHGSAPDSLEELDNLLLAMVQFYAFSCETFCQIFLPQKQETYPIELIISRLTSFMRAVHLGTFNLKRLDQAFAKNPELRLPLMHLSDSFYRAVEAGFIPLDLFHEGISISDFYDPYFLETNCLPGTYMEKPNFPKKMNQIYQDFMSMLIKHPDFESNRLSLIREAMRLFYFLTLRGHRLLKSLKSPQKIEAFYRRFCESHQKREDIYKALIESLAGLEPFHDTLLSRTVQEFIIQNDRWLTITDDIAKDDIHRFFKLLESQFENELKNPILVDRLLQLSHCTAEEADGVIQQINRFMYGEDKFTPFSPTFRLLLECHGNGIDIESIHDILSPLVPLFDRAKFNAPFSISDYIKDSYEDGDLIIKALKGSSFMESFSKLSEEELLDHILYLKHETLKIAANFFGTEAGHEITRSLFASPTRTLCALLLLALGKWQKSDYTQFVKTYIEMHYYYLTDQFFEYPSYGTAIVTPHEPEDQAEHQPNLELYAIFQPHPFANVLLGGTLLAYLKQMDTSRRKIWNEACLAAYTYVPDESNSDELSDPEDE